jgi:hypothetical protein
VTSPFTKGGRYAEQNLIEREEIFMNRQDREARINALRQVLERYDYRTSKYVDGEYTEERWAEIVAERHAWRVELGKLEELL